ncbi:low temperature requirement protein A [Nocardioides sp. CBS4Y-1]|uniref:Low temperature requirement protein A n=2 Tax=Nocardioides acrostichi TaxID=2784339 RepID=A0A930Y5Y6_9ACTN|nr:low temperature requirement protein A [Nocardioides acrostichi]
MTARDPHEPHRAATPLELFFDLVFVVAVATAAVDLHHALTDDHIGHGLVSYAIVFFGIWWAWMNFTWFATSFDTDDWLYRVLTILQMSGVLVLAAGIDPAFEHDDFRLLVAGYVVMRVAMVAQWLRAARVPGYGRTAGLYAAGIAVVQVLWLAWLAAPESLVAPALVVLVLAEIAVPVVAETRGVQAGRGMTPWHAHHITERYGLFTIILLGESLLASGNAIIEALHDDEAVAPLVSIGALAVVVTAALWWIYFWPPHHEAIGGLRQSLRYGYTHYLVFAAAGAVSAGIEVQIDAATHHTELGDVAAGLTLAVPVAMFVLMTWWLAIRERGDAVVNLALPLGAVLVLAEAFVPGPAVVTAVVLVAMVVVLVVRSPAAPRNARER